MKVMIFSHTQRWVVHHAEAIELALEHRSRADQVLFLSCVGSLKGCPTNPDRIKSLCEECNKQTYYTKKNILGSDINHIDFSYKDTTYSLPVFNTAYDLINFTLYDVPFGWLVFCTIAAEINDGLFDIAQKRNRIIELLNDSISVYFSAKQVLSDNNIELVYVWNGRRSCDGPVTYAAKHLGITFKTFISGATISSYDIRPTHYMNDLNYIKEKILDMSETALSNDKESHFYSSATKYFEFSRGAETSQFNHVGFYQFSKSFSDEMAIDMESKKKRMVIYVGTFTEFFGMPEYTREDDLYPNFYEGVKDILERKEIFDDFDIYVRWHPNSRNLQGNEKKILNEIIKNYSPISTHIPPESNLNSYLLLDKADVVICFGTSIVVEACYYRKPAIFIGNNIFEDLDCFYRPKTKEELYSLLQQELHPKSFMDALKYGYYRANRGEYKFKHLKQVSSGDFYYNNINIAYLTMIRKMKKWLKSTIKTVAIKTLQRVG